MEILWKFNGNLTLIKHILKKVTDIFLDCFCIFRVYFMKNEAKVPEQISPNGKIRQKFPVKSPEIRSTQTKNLFQKTERRKLGFF